MDRERQVAQHKALTVHREILRDAVSRYIRPHDEEGQKIIKSPYESQRAIGRRVFGDEVDSFTAGQPLCRLIADTKDRIRSIRTAMLPPSYEPVRNAIWAAKRSAIDAARKARPKAPMKATPTVRCGVNQKPEVKPDSEGGTVWLSVNWTRSVHAEGIAIARYGLEDILIVAAKKQPSAFLSDMGVTLYKGFGMRLGIKTWEVDGSIFKFTVLGETHVLMHENFHRGVSAVQAIIEDALHREFEKVQ